MPNYLEILNVHLSQAVSSGKIEFVSNGVKQGGVLSPVLFTVYVDGIIKELRKKCLGCHFKGKYTCCFI